MRPLLPSAQAILPYLERIDKSRHYTNFGPLNDEYQERLSELFESPVITASSATSALTATLMALDLPPRSFVACPSWTFVATPLSIMAAGHVPYFVDVDDDGVMKVNLKLCIAKCWVVVAPFGFPLDIKKWDERAEEFGVPILIDAAAGFDAYSTICKSSKVPIIISTHATKTFGTGEGGFVTCHNKELMERVRKITSFGLTPERGVDFPGFNAKFSEYHAAVGLAELDGWANKREKFLESSRDYGLTYAVTMIPVRTGEGRKGVYGCHNHKAFNDLPRTHLPQTEEMMENVSLVDISL